ncbi:MAG: calcium-translocating P-type ATPase, PMCA-type [Cyanobacteria bacterium P01_G01_bin.54]
MTSTRSPATTQGLTAEQVLINRQTYGSNTLTPPQRNPWWQLFLEKFADPVIRILMIAAAIAIGVGTIEGEYIEGLGIIVAIFLATTLAFINEYRANQAFEILNQYADDSRVRVIRDGHPTTVPRKELVVGDWVMIEQGDEIPADGEIVEAVSLLIDQSKITGESEPIQKLTRAENETQTLPEEAYPDYLVYRSTIVDQGNGGMVVTAVGDQTEIGRLATAIAAVSDSELTPLNQQLERLSELIGVVGLTFASLTFAALVVRGFMTGTFVLTSAQTYVLGVAIIAVLLLLSQVWVPVVYDGLQLLNPDLEPPAWLQTDRLQGWFVSALLALVFTSIGFGTGAMVGWLPAAGQVWLPVTVGRQLLEYFMVAVTIIVVAVPEGLPMSVTLSLAYSMKRMATANNLVRRMHACETIGATTVICSDKTGTLTRNQMHVYAAEFPALQPDHPQLTALLAEAIAANSTADLDKQPTGTSQVLGNPTEGALLLWLDEQQQDYTAYRNGFAIKFRLSFSTQKKYMATLGHSAVLDHEVIHLKGAPEVLLEKCTHIQTPQGIEPLNQQTEILAALKRYQQRGMRTLGFAYQQLADNLLDNGTGLPASLCWLGFMAIADPLREDVVEAIRACLGAGIQVKVITGDCAETAQEIAHQIGLWYGDETHPYAALSGQAFRQLDDAQALEAAKVLKVLSRAVPLDKLRLVQLLQSDGEVVGVTGDGTNDAGALKQAKVGLAMGSGTAIAKEASDIILLDDSFKSIINAVVWGRSLYKNIQRFILFQLTINVVALGIALLGPFIGISLPLTVTQMLWVNLIMDTFAALALATEPPSRRVLDVPPRDPEAFIISSAMGRNILLTGGIFLVSLTGLLIYLGRDGMTDQELSLFFAIFVLLQFWNLFNARCLGVQQSAFKGLLSSPAFVAIALSILIGQILIIQWGGEVFRTVPLSWDSWAGVIGGTSIVLWVGELNRWLSHRARQRSDA